MIWNGNECGECEVKGVSRETSPLDYDRSETTGECGIFQLIG